MFTSLSDKIAIRRGRVQDKRLKKYLIAQGREALKRQQNDMFLEMGRQTLLKQEAEEKQAAIAAIEDKIKRLKEEKEASASDEEVTS